MQKKSADSAEARIIAAFNTLLIKKPYGAIKVTEIIRLADVNRSTFYKSYTSVPDLFEKQQQSLCGAVLNSDVPLPETPDGMEAYTRALAEQLLRDEMERISLLGGAHGDVRTFWLVGDAIRQKLEQEAERLKIRDEAVLRNIRSAPGFFASLFCERVNESRLQARWQQTLSEDYDVSKTFFENMAIQLCARRGGSMQFHYDLVLSFVKFFDRMVPQVTVTQLLQTAGIGRTEFYQYYRNLEDFRSLYLETVHNCATQYVLYACEAQGDEAAALIAKFSEINYNFVQKTLRGVMERGDIIYYITTLIGCVFVHMSREIPPSVMDFEEKQLKLLYYIGACVSYALAFYAGSIDEPELHRCMARLQRLRQSVAVKGRQSHV